MLRTLQSNAPICGVAIASAKSINRQKREVEPARLVFSNLCLGALLFFVVRSFLTALIGALPHVIDGLRDLLFGLSSGFFESLTGLFHHRSGFFNGSSTALPIVAPAFSAGPPDFSSDLSQPAKEKKLAAAKAIKKRVLNRFMEVTNLLCIVST